MGLEKRPADEEEGYLLRELESLGIEAKRMSELNTSKSFKT